VLLSKFPFSLLSHKYSQSKKLIVGKFSINDRKLLMPVIHLTSDKKKNVNPAQKREFQLAIIYDRLISEEKLDEDCIIIGDFNIDDSPENDTLFRSDFLDVWKVLHPGEPGYTFDPPNNITAKIISSTGLPRRFDRILVRSPQKCWTLKSIDIFANQPFDINIDTEKKCLFPSDHYGLVSLLEFNSDSKQQTTTTVIETTVTPIQVENENSKQKEKIADSV